MIEKMIKIRLENVKVSLHGDLPLEAANDLRETLAYIVPNFEYTETFQRDLVRAEMEGRPPWDGTKTLVRNARGGGLRMPSGLLSYVREILRKHGIEYHIVDERPAASRSAGWTLDGLTLRDYQQEPVELGLNRTRGVMQAATGSGKSEISIAMIVEASAFPAVFYVNSCDLLEQTYDRFMKYVRYNGEVAPIGRVGAGHFDIQPITIATVQTAERALVGQFSKYSYDDVAFDDKMKLSDKQARELSSLVREAQFVLCDECHHVSCDTIQNILNNSHGARFRYGCSASPWRDDGLDILIEAAFGKHFCRIPASFLIESGYLLPPTITFNHFRQSLGPTTNFSSHYTMYVVENEVRNNFIAERARFHVGEGRPTIVLVKWSRHAEILAPLIPGCEVLTSSGKKKKSPKQRKKHLERMRRRELMCIIATTLLDEGVDVPAASAGIFAGGGKSSTRELQRVGRFLRKDPDDPGKDMAHIEEFHEHTRWLTDHARRRRDILNTETAFKITDSSATLHL